MAAKITIKEVLGKAIQKEVDSQHLLYISAVPPIQAD